MNLGRFANLKEMATHSSVLAWRIPGTAEPGGLPSMGSHRVGHDWRDLAVAAAANLTILSLPVHEHNIFSCAFSQLVQSLSKVWLFATPWTAACHASLSITNSWSLLKLMSMESVIPSNHLILWHPLLLLPSTLPIRVFSNESVFCIRWPKYWSLSFSINPSNDYSGLISLRIDWFDLLANQGTLKSLLQHHSSKTSILWHSTFFIVQISHPYMTTRKTIALTRWTFVGKVMSPLLKMLFRLDIAFLLRSKRLLISWLQSHMQWFWSPKN